jgi:NitT/TauT family transport system substrate-binding protein
MLDNPEEAGALLEAQLPQLGLKAPVMTAALKNITYLITTDPKATGLADIKGQSIAVSLQGSVPDLMFQYITKGQGLDAAKDFKVRYATDPTQAAQLLMSGQVENAVLSEALATAVILQTKDSAKPLHRAMAFDKAWVDASGGETPIAGTVATASVLGRPDVIVAFERAYKEAVQWMLDNPEEAGALLEAQLPQLGLKAPVMTAALKNITWRYTPAKGARPDLDAFYQDLTELSPEVIGGKVPDDGFYFDQAD